MRTLLFLLISLCIVGCETNKKSPPLEYLHADQEQSINCEGQNNILLNEALYSFESDLIRNYDSERQRIAYGYARFIVPGFTGTAEFERLPSEHSKNILKKLIEEKIIIPNNQAKSNLDYSHPAVDCIINSSEDGAVKQTLTSLIEVGSMDPKLLDTRLRNKGRDLHNQRNLALYVALDAYYQNLANIDFSASSASVENK